MIKIMSKSKKNTNTNYQRRLNNTKIFANALFKGEVVLMKDVNDPKNVGIYVPKEYLNSKPTNGFELEFTVSKNSIIKPSEAC